MSDGFWVVAANWSRSLLNSYFLTALAGALAAALAATPANADEGTFETGVDGALEFAQCAGLYYASADLGPEFGHLPDDVQLARELGNGAALAGQYMLAHVREFGASRYSQVLRSHRNIWNRAWQEAGAYIQDQVASNRTHWRSRLRGSGNPAVAKYAELCARLNPLQVEIVQEMRRNLLTKPGPESRQ